MGIVGCGAIGSSLAEAVRKIFSARAKLSGLYDKDTAKAVKLACRLHERSLALSGISAVIDNSDLIIEATSAAASSGIAEKALTASKDILVMSVGGIAGCYERLKALAEKRKGRIFIPSGAICGMDGLKAAALTKIKKVVLTSRKPPQAFLGNLYLSGKKINLQGIRKETILFEGNALQAIKAFPQNVNVAVALGLAGIGPRRTIVRVVASPGLKRNIHEIEISSDAVNIFTRTENKVHPDNPKTSYLAVLSAVAALKNILGYASIGT